MFLKIPAKIKSIDTIRRFIRKISTSFKLSKISSHQLDLIVYEACLNIIIHGYKNKKGDIAISVVDKPDKVIVSIRDRGESFDWENVPVPDFKKVGKHKNGLGVWMIKKLANEAKYVSKLHYSELILTKCKNSV